MASLARDPASGRFRVRFRYDGREYHRSLYTREPRAAQAGLGQVEEALRMLQLGLIEMPTGVDAGLFIVSGARARREMRAASKVQTLADLLRVYLEELPPGSKEERTLDGERLHFRHLMRHLGAQTRLSALKPATIQRYVALRSQDRYAGRAVRPETIKKDIVTLRLVWNWARRQEYVTGPPPIDRVIYPKRDEKPPFRTMAEIQRALASGNASPPEAAPLWESLYLTREEVDQLLAYVRTRPAERFVYPMFVLVAHTGMRRSELLRSQQSDFDFQGRTISVREKKRSRKHALSYRRAPMSRLVAEVFTEYFAARPPGGHALLQDDGGPVDVDRADNRFEAALRGSPWENVRGFHVFRHSFASNAAAEGIDQRMIDGWMGHQTEEMRRRYRHLSPGHQQAAIDAVYGPPDPCSDAAGR